MYLNTDRKATKGHKQVDTGTARRYLNIVEEDEFPSMEMCANSNVHILDGGPLQPPARLLQRLNPPYTGSPIEAKEIEEDPINLLLHLKMKSQIDELQPRKQILILVHKRPPCLDQS